MAVANGDETKNLLKTNRTRTVGNRKTTKRLKSKNKSAWSRDLALPAGYVDTKGYAEALGVPYQVIRHAMALKSATESGNSPCVSISYPQAKRVASQLIPPAGIIGTARVWQTDQLKAAGLKLPGASKHA